MRCPRPRRWQKRSHADRPPLFAVGNEDPVFHIGPEEPDTGNGRIGRGGTTSLKRFILVALSGAVLLATACARATTPFGVESPTPRGSTGTVTPDTTNTTSPQPSPTESFFTTQVWQLRYVLLDHYANFAYRDPDYYPVARLDEQSAADDWWAQANRSSSEVRTILMHRGYREPLTKDQRLTAYRDHKKLSVIMMRSVAGGYEYQLSISTSGGEGPDHTVTGLVSFDGTVSERSRSLRPGGCPICLEAHTHIGTPLGDVFVADLRPGDLVWTVDGRGRRIVAPVERVVRRPTPGPHLMLRLALSDGRVLVAAGAHPAADGQSLRELRLGERYDGATITSIGWVPSTAPATYDVLPAGPTGDYWANGILIGSTLTTAAAPA